MAQSYTQMQVLMPGESPAPGTSQGKSGQPDTQTVGVPFEIRSAHVTIAWNPQSSITSQVQVVSSDVTATPPGGTQ